MQRFLPRDDRIFGPRFSQSFLESLATLNPARHIQPALERLSVFILDIAAITPCNEYFQARRLTREFVAREVVNFAKLVIYPQSAPFRFEFSKASASAMGR